MSWKPDQYPSMSPYLMCADPDALIRFLEVVFDGKLLRRYDRPDGSLMHCEVQIDDSVVMVGGSGVKDVTGQHIHLYVPDAEKSFARAVVAGATVVQPLERKPDDDLRGGVQDASGTTWWIASQ